MRIFADCANRRLLLSVSAVLGVYALLIQLLCGGFSLRLLVLSLAASAVIAALCILYFRERDRVVEDAARHVTRYLSGRKDERIDCDEDGELYYFFHTVNTLSAVLNAQSEREKQTNEFLKTTVSDISHQLKTPLSALGIYNELIADAEDTANIKRFAAASSAEIERMDSLVRNMLKLARLDASAAIFDKHPENIADIMDELRQRFACRAEMEEKELRFTGGDDIFICDAQWLTEAFGNILKNALDHTARGAIISAEWKRVGDIMNVTFRDNGSGIHPEDITHIFKRFYRSRFSQDTQGVGLGLPLAKTIIEAHGGMIEAQSEPERGTVFSVSFQHREQHLHVRHRKAEAVRNNARHRHG